MRKAWIAIAQLTLVACLSYSQQFTDKQIGDDIDYLKAAIIENYPYLDVHMRKD